MMGTRRTNWEEALEKAAGAGAPRMWVLDDTPFHGASKSTRDPKKGRKEMHLPAWLEQAEEWAEISPARFVELRTLIHHISIEQCAALLRVPPLTVRRWENGSTAIPFAAFMALRLLSDVRYLPHQVKEWDGWKIINAGPDVGMLYDESKSGELFSPVDLRQSRWVRGERDAWQHRATVAEAKAAELEAENTRLRQTFAAQGVTAELRKMHDQIGPLQARLAALLGSIGTADVIEHKPVRLRPKVRKAA